jgi:hypothetical protein
MTMRPADLEALVGRTLRELPQPRAPRTLLPRVLAAAQRWSQPPWYARAWFTWPVGWQAATIVALSAIAAVSYVLLPEIYAAVQGALPFGARTGRVAAVLARAFTVAVDVGAVFWRTLFQPVAPYASAVILLMGFAGAVFGMALNQVVLGRMSQR